MAYFTIFAAITNETSDLKIVAPLSDLYDSETDAVKHFIMDKDFNTNFLINDNKFYSGKDISEIDTFKSLQDAVNDSCYEDTVGWTIKVILKRLNTLTSQ